jgi:hypothetical protein
MKPSPNSVLHSPALDGAVDDLSVDLAAYPRTPTELAQDWGVTADTVRIWARAGMIIGAVQVGNRWRFADGARRRIAADAFPRDHTPRARTKAARAAFAASELAALAALDFTRR